MLNQIEQREVFHIAFLRQLAPRLKPNSYALKGGVNLRLFCGSPRYSEDMDIDVAFVPVFRLRDIVLEILSSKTLQSSLKPFQIEKIVPPDIKNAKQTDTTQRFKVHLITSAGEDLFAKIEFSRRKVESGARTEAVDEGVLRRYRISPLLVSHYPYELAIRQKIGALAGRAQTQARDIFDIYMLLPKCERNIKIESPFGKAYDNVFNVSFEVFRDTVLEYLSKDDRSTYGRKEVWEEMQTKVGSAIQEMMKR